MRHHGWILACFALLTGLASPRAALALSPETPTPRTAAERAAVAEALFDQGKRLMAMGRFAEACSRFTESERIDHGVGTLLNLADCYEQSGQTASAWAEFRAAAAAASAERQTERERIAREREQKLQPLLARLKIVVPPAGALPGLVVKRDALVLEKSSWGVAVPVDPGEHTIEVSAPGKRTYARTIKVPRWGGAWITATVPPLADLPAATPPAPTPAPAQGLRGQQTAGIIVGGAGIAGGVAGSALGVHAISRNNDAKVHCRGDLCDASGAAIRRDARAAGTASTVAFLVAGAALAGGAALYFTAPTPGRVTASPTVSAAVGLTPSGGGLMIGATW